MSNFNLKILFNDRKQVRLIERGDFPPLDSSSPVRNVNKMSQEDSYVRWVTDPENTGVKGILSLLDLNPAPSIKVVGFNDNEYEVSRLI